MPKLLNALVALALCSCAMQPQETSKQPQSTVSICKTFGPCKADCNAELRGCQDLRFEDGDRGSCIVTDGSRSACVKNLGCDDRTTACYDQTIYINGSAYSFE